MKFDFKKISNMVSEDRLRKHSLTLILFTIAVVGFFHYRHPVIILVGLIVSITDLLWELHCVKHEMWTYSSKYLIMGRIPMSIPITYFLIGCVGTIYVLFRLGF